MNELAKIDFKCALMAADNILEYHDRRSANNGSKHNRRVTDNRAWLRDNLDDVIYHAAAQQTQTQPD